MTRAEVEAHVRAANERFQRRIAPVVRWQRNMIAASARALALEIEPVDFSESAAIKKLAALIQAPREDHASPSDRYALPPDNEGDEPLLERMKKCRAP